MASVNQMELWVLMKKVAKELKDKDASKPKLNRENFHKMKIEIQQDITCYEKLINSKLLIKKI